MDISKPVDIQVPNTPQNSYSNSPVFIKFIKNVEK
jgi:hypothetical protein